MGNEGSRRVVERVADVIDRIGDAQDGAASAEPTTETGAEHSEAGTEQSEAGTEQSEAETKQSEAATDRSEAGADRSDEVTAVTDGGADEASPGNGNWSADDPITFDDESEEDPGTAILEAVTDEESTSPFGDLGDDAAVGGDAVSEDRLDELEARIGALESDHVALESQLDDVASALTELGSDVDGIGDDVLELVTLFGAIALSTGQPAEASIDAGDVAAEIASKLDDRSTAAVADVDDADRGGRRADAADSTSSSDQSDASEAAASSDDTDGAIGADATPDGIHRGVADAPADSRDGDVPADSRGADVSGDTKSTASTHETGADAQTATDDTRDETDEAAGEPSRALVDPRTDAVGARLRQFREGFVDDPTEDLPTGSSADDFRFEKVLLPSDGAEAPDLSTEELAKPYLEALPDGYAADAVVLEWLDWLVSAADGETAARAIGYYESIDWLTEDAREALLGYLDGLGDVGAVDGSTPVHEPPAALDLQDHLRSLQYVTELATGEVDADGI